MPSRTTDVMTETSAVHPAEPTPARSKPAKVPGSPTKREEKPKAQDVAELKDFQLGDCLGRGAFGSVYRALNWGTGETVAVKQIKLADLPKSELRVIMLEIDLLKNLDHPNIVKYHGFVKTPETLNIILEYCENGSLHSISKNFGRFPENLVALYMSQALHGLCYLHDQGVIHRDIKGANILNTKSGLVKLADFGVASRTTGLHESSVVGTPYWMAPEVIELTGATTASDVWSLGCTVIELLEGRPPYYNLQPMPALFRIVNDDHPPLPQGASPVVIDFLMQCFQKDPNLRVSAKKLLKHPWIVNARRSDSQIASKTDYQEAVKSVQQWNEALRDSPNGHTIRKNSTASSSDSPVPGPRDVLRPLKSPTKQVPINVRTRADVTEKFRSIDDDDSDNWDNDFATAITPGALHLPHLKPVDNFGGMLSSDRLKAFASMDASVQQSDRNDENVATVKPVAKASESVATKTSKAAPKPTRPQRGHARNKSEMPKPRTTPVQSVRKVSLPTPTATVTQKVKIGEVKGPAHPKSKTLYRESSIEDYSDIIEGNESLLDSRLNALRPSQEFVPSKVVDSPTVNDLMQSMKLTNGAATSRKPKEGRKRGPMRRTRSSVEIQKFAENEDDEDFSDVFGHTETSTAPAVRDASSGSDPFTLNSIVSGVSWKEEDADEDDPFASLEEGLPEADLESNIARDKHARMRNEVEMLVGQLKVVGDEEDALLHISEELIHCFEHFSETKNVIVSAHGLLPMLEILEDCTRFDIILNLLKIINTIIYGDEDVQENLCFVGGIPKILLFASKQFPREIRLEAAAFVRQMYQTTTLILQMFVSAGGLNVLVDFLEDDYDEDRELVLIGVNGIWSVFELQGSTPRNDFCRILSRSSVLEPLSQVLVRVLNEPADSGEQRELAELCEGRISSIFFIFSQAENYVKEKVAERSVLHRLLKNLKKMSPIHQITMLKFIKNLSMLEMRWETLSNSNAIDVLVELLSDGLKQPHFRELANQILGTIYNLCRVSKRRQEDAALAGIIPVLINIAKQDNTPVRQFALPILCDMVQAGRAARRELWQNKGLAFYVSLLSDTYWQGTALDSIFVWLQEETARVQDALLDNQNFTKAVVKALMTSKSVSFENLLEPLKKLLRLSPALAEQMASSPELFESIGLKLEHSKPAIRLNLLHIISSIRDATESGSFLLDQYGLYQLVSDLQYSDPAVLVQSMARELIRSCEEMDNISNYSDPRAHTSNSSRNGRRPVMIRRPSSGTTPPHLIERQIIPTSPQLSRPSINYFDGSDRVTQTPRRQRNGPSYMNGVNGSHRPVSRDSSNASFVREGSPAVPVLNRAQTSSVVDLSVNRSRLPRQSGAHRLSRQSTRESMNGSMLKEQVVGSATPTQLPSVAERSSAAERRKENVQENATPSGERQRRIANRTVEINQAGGGRRPPASARRHNTVPEDGWA